MISKVFMYIYQSPNLEYVHCKRMQISDTLLCKYFLYTLKSN